MSMYLEIVVLCIMARPQFCLPVQPMTNVDQQPTILSLINCTVNGSAYRFFESDRKYANVKISCERPLPGKPDTTTFVNYEVALCMALYDATQRFCMAGRPDVTKKSQNFSSHDFCDTMVEGIPKPNAEQAVPWVDTLRAKFKNISNCQQACIGDNMINPVCEYILSVNTLANETQMSATSADISPAGNTESQVNSQVDRKVNQTITNKDKASEKKSGDSVLPPVIHKSVLNDERQMIEHVDNKTTVREESAARKDVDHAEANSSSTRSGSENNMHSNITEQTYTTVSKLQNDNKKDAQDMSNKMQNDAKKQGHTAGSNAQSGVNKQVHSTNSSVQNNVKKQGHTADSNTQNGVKKQGHTVDSNTQNGVNKQPHSTNSSGQNNVKKQEHAINSNNQSAKVMPTDAAVLRSEETEHTPEAEKYDGSTGKGITSDSRSRIAPQAGNKNSADGFDSELEEQNQNNDNEDSITQADGSYLKSPDGDDFQNNDEGQVEEKGNLDHPGEQSEQIPKETEIHQEEAETGNTAKFNQLGDADDSHFYAYFMTMVVICIIGYLVFHNKQKILALALEGRSRRGTRRRPNTSAYRKLDSNLEEAVTSACSTSVTHVIY